MKIGWGDYGSEMRLTFAVDEFEDRQTYFGLRHIMDRDKVTYTTEVVFGPPASRTLVIQLTGKAGVFRQFSRKHRNWCDRDKDRDAMKQDILRLVAEEEKQAPADVDKKLKGPEPSRTESGGHITYSYFCPNCSAEIVVPGYCEMPEMEEKGLGSHLKRMLFKIGEQLLLRSFSEVKAPADSGINYCQMRIRTVITPDGKRVEGLEPMSGPGLDPITAERGKKMEGEWDLKTIANSMGRAKGACQLPSFFIWAVSQATVSDVKLEIGARSGKDARLYIRASLEADDKNTVASNEFALNKFGFHAALLWLRELIVQLEKPCCRWHRKNRDWAIRQVASYEAKNLPERETQRAKWTVCGECGKPLKEGE